MRKLLSSPLIYLFFFFVISIGFWSCSKSNDTTPNNILNNFTLTHQGSTYTANKDSAVTTSIGPFFIVANFSQGFFWRVQMNLTSFNVNNYPFGGSSGNTLWYVDSLGNPTDVAFSGSINITANDNNRMSGNFTATVKDMSNTTHTTSGTFTNMPISF